MVMVFYITIKLGDIMQTFLSDFSFFMELVFSGIASLWNWLMSTILGEIILFGIIIGIFFIIFNLFIDSKD